MKLVIKGILLVIAASLVLAPAIAYSLNSWGDLDGEFYQRNFDPDKKKIFLIGSSQVHTLNATFIENHISKSQNDFEVYNIARDIDSPKERIDELQDIIHAKPAIVGEIGPPNSNRLSVGLQYPRRSAANYEGGSAYLRLNYKW